MQFLRAIQCCLCSPCCSSCCFTPFHRGKNLHTSGGLMPGKCSSQKKCRRFLGGRGGGAVYGCPPQYKHPTPRVHQTSQVPPPTRQGKRKCARKKKPATNRQKAKRPVQRGVGVFLFFNGGEAANAAPQAPATNATGQNAAVSRGALEGKALLGGVEGESAAVSGCPPGTDTPHCVCTKPPRCHPPRHREKGNVCQKKCQPQIAKRRKGQCKGVWVFFRFFTGGKQQMQPRRPRRRTPPDKMLPFLGGH